MIPAACAVIRRCAFGPPGNTTTSLVGPHIQAHPSLTLGHSVTHTHTHQPTGFTPSGKTMQVSLTGSRPDSLVPITYPYNIPLFQVSPEDLVPGDIVSLQTGVRVPSDMRVLSRCAFC